MDGLLIVVRAGDWMRLRMIWPERLLEYIKGAGRSEILASTRNPPSAIMYSRTCMEVPLTRWGQLHDAGKLPSGVAFDDE